MGPIRSHRLDLTLTISLSSDEALLRFSSVRDMKAASAQDMTSVRNWLDGHKPLVRSESQIFNGSADAALDEFVYLGNTAPSEDSAGDTVERWLERMISRAPYFWQKVRLGLGSDARLECLWETEPESLTNVGLVSRLQGKSHLTRSFYHVPRPIKIAGQQHYKR